ncbi:histidine phosphatase family protein [Bifidobacterium sp. ESL0769]|uniref:histidine phosphatase family protein n=1 Tax=Bifidobacterium sp. ESL0769 TaxID=2983229 RepID=UPI0023F68798|nr:histidine phosphatase family protein [Bifidobacterium sp. ESL0769]WEV67195.1 histidine phosphatase family protein [Bifidobacterium sp. ESL0769]
MNSTIIYLTRHTETTANKMGIMQGWSDFPVTRHGREIIKCLGLGFKGITFDAAYCASLPRHYATARGALDYSGNETVKLISDPDLREANFGSFEGRNSEKTLAEALKHLGYTEKTAVTNLGINGIMDVQNAMHDLDAEDVLGTNLDSEVRAETAAEVLERMNRGMTRVGETIVAHGGGNALVVSSGLSIAHFLIAIDSTLNAKGMDNAAVTKLRYENGTFSIVGPVGSLEYYEKGKASMSN